MFSHRQPSILNVLKLRCTSEHRLPGSLQTRSFAPRASWRRLGSSAHRVRDVRACLPLFFCLYSNLDNLDSSRLIYRMCFYVFPMCFYVFLCVSVCVCVCVCVLFWFVLSHLVPSSYCRAWESAKRFGVACASWSIFSAFPFWSVSCQLKRVAEDFMDLQWFAWALQEDEESPVEQNEEFVCPPSSDLQKKEAKLKPCETNDVNLVVCFLWFDLAWFLRFSGWVSTQRPVMTSPWFHFFAGCFANLLFFSCARHGSTCSWWLNDPTLLVSSVSGVSTILPILQRFSAWGRISCLAGVLSTQRFRRMTTKLNWLPRWGRPENY